jgi:hypothetical protein
MEVDMVSTGFRPLLTSNAVNGFQTVIGTWFTTNFPNSEWNIVLARGTPNPTNVRQVVGFQISDKIAVKKLNNRYYDRP